MAEISIAYRNGMVVAKPLSDDDEDESPGRILTVEEFLDRLRNRSDIFGVDKNHRLRNSELVALVFGIIAGFLTVTREPAPNVKSDYYEKNHASDQAVVAISSRIIDRDLSRPTTVKRPVADVEGRKKLRRNNSSIATNQYSERSSSGNIRSRIANNAFFASVAQNMRGIDAAGGDLFGKGGFGEKLDAILAGKAGLSKGGMTSTGRKGYEHIGYGPGHGKSGYDGEGPGGDNDMFDGLMPPKESDWSLALKTGPPDRIGRIRNASISTIETGVGFRGEGRSKSEIMRVVLQNLSALRYAYNQRLRDRPGLSGKITIKFAVDEFGSVIACEVIGSSVADGQLETIIKGKILRWRFDKINKPGDITEVVYPFVFST